MESAIISVEVEKVYNLARTKRFLTSKCIATKTTQKK